MGNNSEEDDKRGGSGFHSAEDWSEPHSHSPQSKKWTSDYERDRRLEKELADEHHSHNLFSTFKRFIDDNLGVLSSSFDLKSAWQKEMEQRQAEEHDISYRWTGSLETPDDIEREAQNTTREERLEVLDSVISLYQQSDRTTRHNISRQKVEALYHDPESEWGYLDLLGFESQRGNPVSDLILGTWGSKPRWLSVDWFKRSPYSPVRLEAYNEMNGSGRRWRAAFEDLLCAELDQPMRSDVAASKIGVRTPFGRPQFLHEAPGLDWMLSLHCRGILPLRGPSTYSAWMPSTMAREKFLGSLGFDTSRWVGLGRVPEGSRLAEDFGDLLKAVATKATTETEAETAPMISPETEQDLYDLLPTLARSEMGREKFSLLSERVKQQHDQPTREEEQAMALYNDKSGGEQEKNHRIALSLRDAILSEDVQSATKIINDWYHHGSHRDDGNGGGVEQFYSDMLNQFLQDVPGTVPKPWFPTLNEALRRSDLPRDSGSVDNNDNDDGKWENHFVSSQHAEAEAEEEEEEEYERERFDNKAPKDKKTQEQKNSSHLANLIISLIKQRQRDSEEEEEEEEEALRQQRESLGLEEIFPVSSASSADSNSSLRKSTSTSTSTDAGYETSTSTPTTMVEKNEKKKIVRDNENENEKQKNEKNKPNILSALTTTHTVRTPDGVVVTKVVLKQRFSDGREETTESLHTTREDGNRNENGDGNGNGDGDQRGEMEGQSKEEKEKEDKQKKKKGWFWS